jgi:hypothetical protein
VERVTEDWACEPGETAGDDDGGDEDDFGGDASDAAAEGAGDAAWPAAGLEGAAEEFGRAGACSFDASGGVVPFAGLLAG